MPELPDVQVFREYVDATSLHAPVARAHVDAARELRGVTARSLSATLHGRSLERTRRHGKHLFVALSGAPRRWLRLHFGMTGSLQAWSSGDTPEPSHVRLRLDLKDGRHLVYRCVRRLGEIGLVAAPEETIDERASGADPVEDDLDREGFVEAVGGRRGSIKSTLMNQSVLAGLGNVYSDEILFQAGIAPRTPVPELGDEALDALHRVMGRVLRKAIEVRADPERMPRRWLTPQREEGRACPRCDGRIRKVSVAGRSAYACDRHQARA